MRRGIVVCLLVLAAGCAKKEARLELTGSYEDWDSDPDRYFPIAGATLTEVDGKGTATTAEDGQVKLSLRGAAVVRFEAEGYLPARYTVEPSAARWPFAARGMLLSRVARFHQSLGLTWDPTMALVEIEVRRHPGGAAVDGVKVSLAGVSGYRRNWNGGYSPTTVTGEGGMYIVFPNIAVATGAVPLEVHASCLICHAPPLVHVAAGEVALATVACTATR